MTLDVTSPADIRRAAAGIDTLDVLVNNAGIAAYDDLSDAETLVRHLAVNLVGTLQVTRAFLPQLARARGAVLNHLSILAFAPLPIVPSYSASKSAASSLTQSLRALLADSGVSVHAVFLGPVDTEMNRGLDIPKAAPSLAARGILDGLELGMEDIFPDPMAATLADGWHSGFAKAFERQNAGALLSAVGGHQATAQWPGGSGAVDDRSDQVPTPARNTTISGSPAVPSR